jgi:putative transposase
MIKTYTLYHQLQLDGFFLAYNRILNAMIDETWDNIKWIKKPKKGSKQERVFPSIPDYSFKKSMRDAFLATWTYAAHWIDSAIKTAFSIINSWKKNYNKGRRKRHKPVVKRFFVRVKQTLMKLDEDRLRITIKPREFVYIDLSKRYFSLNGKMGEPILTDTCIHLPITLEDEELGSKDVIGWDSNKFSIDGYSECRGWIRVDIKPLHTLHITHDNKFRKINRIYAKNKNLGKKLYAKYRMRCKNRVKNYLCHVANQMNEIPAIHGFESLEKKYMFKQSRHKWNRELNHADWRQIYRLVKSNAETIEVNPAWTSKRCSRCGATNKSLRAERTFECPSCGLKIDRQLNASINIYLKMRGVSPDVTWFDTTIIPGGLPLMGAETRDGDELASHLDELMKPQVYLGSPMIT